MKNFKNLNLCLIDDDGRLCGLYDELLCAGCGTLISHSSDHFFRQIVGGGKYDAVVADARADSKWKLILEICEAVGTPVIFILHPDAQEIFRTPCRNRVYFDVIPSSPFNIAELLWRLDALLARASLTNDLELPAHDYSWGDYRFINGARTVVQHGGREIPLQRKQFIFALALFQNVGSVVSREHLARCFGESLKEGSRSIDVYAVHIRKKLALRAENGLVLRAVYRRGYQLVSVANANIAPNAA